jgi:hypothetical protein
MDFSNELKPDFPPEPHLQLQHNHHHHQNHNQDNQDMEIIKKESHEILNEKANEKLKEENKDNNKIEELNIDLPPRDEWLTSKWKILKNLIVIGMAWMFLFTAYQSMANLQSSLNSDEGLGTASLSTIYITLVVSCLFIPPVMIKNIGLKWTIVISQVCYLLFIAANMYPKWYILIPGEFQSVIFYIVLI